MRLRLVLAALAACLLISAVEAADFDMIEGRLFRKDGMMTRLITLQNNTSRTASIAVECGFLKGGELLGNGAAMFYNLSPGQRAHGEATSTEQISADKTECRIGVVDRDSSNAHDAKTHQHLKALEDLSTKQDECLAAIQTAQRHGNVWQEENLSMEECRDVAMKLIRTGSKLMEDSIREESDPD